MWFTQNQTAEVFDAFHRHELMICTLQSRLPVGFQRSLLRHRFWTVRTGLKLFSTNYSACSNGPKHLDPCCIFLPNTLFGCFTEFWNCLAVAAVVLWRKRKPGDNEPWSLSRMCLTSLLPAAAEASSQLDGSQNMDGSSIFLPHLCSHSNGNTWTDL